MICIEILSEKNNAWNCSLFPMELHILHMWTVHDYNREANNLESFNFSSELIWDWMNGMIHICELFNSKTDHSSFNAIEIHTDRQWCYHPGLQRSINEICIQDNCLEKLSDFTLDGHIEHTCDWLLFRTCLLLLLWIKCTAEIIIYHIIKNIYFIFRFTCAHTFHIYRQFINKHLSIEWNCK